MAAPTEATQVLELAERAAETSRAQLAADLGIALASVRALVQIVARAGGYMAPEQQAAYQAARLLLGLGATKRPWVDR